jgi:DNA-binding NarL/FixJ family response regulator
MAGAANAGNRRGGGDDMTIRVVLATRGPAPHDVLKQRLEDPEGVSVVACTDDVPCTVLQAGRVGAEVVIITKAFADQFLVDLCSQVQALHAGPKILLVDDEGNEESLLLAIEAGVDGYVASTSDIGEAVRALSRGESVIPPAMLGPLLRRLIERRREAAVVAEYLVQLTPREREVLLLLVEGLDQGAISRSLFISPDTARTHIQRVLRKLGVHSRAEAISLFSRTGLADRLERMVERSMS